MLLVSIAPLRSQNPQESKDVVPLFKSQVQNVIVDVVVTNSKDEPVSGLIKDDFTVIEDGQKQPISFFEEHKGPVSTQTTSLPLPPHVYINFPVKQTSDVVNVLLLDWMNTHPRDQAYVRAQVIKYLTDAPPGTCFAVFVLGENLRMAHGLTTDSQALVTAFKNNKDETAPLISRLSASQEITPEMLAPTPQMTTQESLAAQESGLNSSNAFVASSRIATTIEALKQLARYLSAIPGRKNLLWFAGSFPITIFPTTDAKTFRAMGPHQAELQQTSDLLTPGQVAIYPIAAQGLVGLQQYEAENARAPTLAETRRMDLERAANQIAMEELARDTGGKAFYNANALNDAIAHAINDGTRYYTLTYSPTNKNMNGKFRLIQVKLLGDNYKLSYRHGYYADEHPKTSVAKSNDDPLMPMMAYGLPQSSQVVYKISVEPASPQPDKTSTIVGGNIELKRPVTRYKVEFAVALQDMKMETTSDGKHQGKIEIALVAYDRQGAPVNWVVEKPLISLDPITYADAAKVGLQLHLDLDVPNGDIHLKTGVCDLVSRKVGTLEVPVNPDASTH